MNDIKFLEIYLWRHFCGIDSVEWQTGDRSLFCCAVLRFMCSFLILWLACRKLLLFSLFVCFSSCPECSSFICTVLIMYSYHVMLSVKCYIYYCNKSAMFGKPQNQVQPTMFSYNVLYQLRKMAEVISQFFSVFVAFSFVFCSLQFLCCFVLFPSYIWWVSLGLSL